MKQKLFIKKCKLLNFSDKEGLFCWLFRDVRIAEANRLSS